MKGPLSSRMSSFLAVIPEDVEWMTRDLSPVIVDGKRVGTSVLEAMRNAGLIEIVKTRRKRGMWALRVWRLTEYGKVKKGGMI